jgi:hypothetical protein
MQRHIGMTNKFIKLIAGLALVLIVAFYWVGKSSPSFQGIDIPDFAILLQLILGLAGAARVIIGQQRFNLSEIFFAVTLSAIPIIGNVAEIIFYAAPSSKWSGFIDDNLLNSNNWMGFRSPITTAIIFLFASSCLASLLSNKIFIASLALGLIPHAVWGAGQFLYLFQPTLLNSLPIKVGGFGVDGFGLHIVRAVGLTTNPFYYSWLFLVSSLSFALTSKDKGAAMVSMIFSFVSLSRAFFVASLPLFLFFFKNKSKYIYIILIIALLSLFFTFFMPDVQIILEKRFATDVSAQVRLQTNILSLTEIERGNYFGIGYSNGFVTDSTYASQLLRSGIPGLILFVCAWLAFFYRLWIVSGRKNEVNLFAFIFFASSFFVGAVESQPGSFVLFTLYWLLKKDFQIKGLGKPPCNGK